MSYDRYETLWPEAPSKLDRFLTVAAECGHVALYTPPREGERVGAMRTGADPREASHA